MTWSPHIPITVPTRRLLMDWGLVLASQGIEAELRQDEAGYSLWIAENDYMAARQALSNYTHENRNRALPSTPSPPLGQQTVHPAALLWAAVMILAYSLGENAPILKEWGSMHTTRFARGEWWRPLTAMFLHVDISHLLSNLTFGVIFLGLAMSAAGVFRAFLISSAAGILGFLAGLLIYPANHQSIGASGLVMGALGVLAAVSVKAHWHPGFRWRALLRGAGPPALLFVLIGFAPWANTIAHVGGFVFGFLGEFLLMFLSREANLSSRRESVALP